MGFAWSIGHAPFGDQFLSRRRLIITCGLAVMVWAALATWKAQTTIIPHEYPKALMETGPFRFLRNPIYLADLSGGVECNLGQSFCSVASDSFFRGIAAPLCLTEEARMMAYWF